MATQTYEQLIAGANKIKENELPESNTHDLVGEQLLQMTNKMQEESTKTDNSIMEYNVSKFHPNSGINGSNKYTLETAIAQIPLKYRTIGLKCSFENRAGQGETWAWMGNSWNGKYFKEVGNLRISSLEYESFSNSFDGSNFKWLDGRVIGSGSFENSTSYKNTGFIAYKGGTINCNKNTYRVSFFKEPVYNDSSKFIKSVNNISDYNTSEFLESVKEAKYFVAQFNSSENCNDITITQGTSFMSSSNAINKFASLDFVKGLFYGKWHDNLDKLSDSTNFTFLIPIRKGCIIKAEGLISSSLNPAAVIYDKKIAKVAELKSSSGILNLDDSIIEDSWAFVSFAFIKASVTSNKLKIHINGLPCISEIYDSISENRNNIQNLKREVLFYLEDNEAYQNINEIDNSIVSFQTKNTLITEVGIKWITHSTPTDRCYLYYVIGGVTKNLNYANPYNEQLEIIKVENDDIYLAIDFSKVPNSVGGSTNNHPILFKKNFLNFSSYNELLNDLKKQEEDNGLIELTGDNKTIENINRLRKINRVIKELRISRELVYDYFIRVLDLYGSEFRLQIVRNSKATGYNSISINICNFQHQLAELEGIVTISEPSGVYITLDIDYFKTLTSDDWIFDNTNSIWKIKDKCIYDTYPFDMSNYRNLFSMFWSSAYCIPWMYKRYVDTNYIGSDGSNAYGTTPPYRKSTGAMNTCIVINTDPHECCIDSLMRINKWPMIDIDAKATIDCFLNLGDLFVSGGSPTKEAYKKKFDDIWKAHNKLGYRQKPQLYALGNHDLNQDGGQSVNEMPTKEELYELLFKPMLARWSKNHTSLDTGNKYSDYEKLDIHTDELNPNKVTYYYVDFEYDKLRMIVMDNYDHPLFNDCYSSRGFSQSQLDFVKKAVDEAPVDYCIWVTSHEGVGPNAGYNDSYNVMRTLILAYANKTALSSNLTNNTDSSKSGLDNGDTIKRYSFDYTLRNGKIFGGCGHGHFFTDTIGIKSVNIFDKPIVEEHEKCPLGVRWFTFIASGARKLLHRGTMTDGADILVYDDEQGVRFVRYGCCPGRYGSKGVPSDPDFSTNPLLQPTDGTDDNGFYLVNTPWIPTGMNPKDSK